MSDLISVEGKVEGIEIKTGPKKKYAYVKLKDVTIGGNDMKSKWSGNWFDVKKAQELRNKSESTEGDFHVKGNFTENPSEERDEPFKNIKELEEDEVDPHIEQEAVEEKKESPFFKDKVNPKMDNFASGAFFGMISNQTMEYLGKKISIPDGKGIGSPQFEEQWNLVFDKLWELNIKKRAEVLK